MMQILNIDHLVISKVKVEDKIYIRKYDSETGVTTWAWQNPPTEGLLQCNPQITLALEQQYLALNKLERDWME